MPDITPIEKLRLPFGNQEVEFQHLVHEAGGVPFLRVRIRENKRFTIFDIDPESASKWVAVMQTWMSDHPNPADQALAASAPGDAA